MLKALSKWLGGNAGETPAEKHNPAAPSIASAAGQTQQSLIGKIRQLFGAADAHDSPVLDAQALDDHIDQIEEILLRADVGLDTALEITGRLRQNKSRLKTEQDVLDEIHAAFSAILTPFENSTQLALAPAGSLSVILVVGVNGAGKTTLIGKLAHQLIQSGRRVVIGAGDTFRAAATDQLAVWAERAGAAFVQGPDQCDPASVIFDTLTAARAQNADIVLLDTAGRLQNKFNLMEELRKIRKVIDKDVSAHPGTTLESLLVLDATTGQNALRQAEVFQEAVALSGVALTKLDGSAKGGVILAIARQFRLPVKLVGVGEGINDLQPFDSAAFIDALFQR